MLTPREVTEFLIYKGKPYDERLSRTVWGQAEFREGSRSSPLFFMVKSIAIGT